VNRELRLFFTALTFFTRIPCARFSSSDEQDYALSAKYLPLLGIVVGAVAASVYIAAHHVFPTEIAVLASMAASLWLTGAFHEDGLADAADGLGGGWDKEHILNIMKDSRLGSYGAIALFLVLLAKFQTLTYLDPFVIPATLIAGHAISRLGAVMVMATQTYVRADGKAKPFSSQLNVNEWRWSALFGLAPLILLSPRQCLVIIPVVLVWLWFSRLLKRRLDGYTGDCLGAMQQLCEIAFYLGILGIS